MSALLQAENLLYVDPNMHNMHALERADVGGIATPKPASAADAGGRCPGDFPPPGLAYTL